MFFICRPPAEFWPEQLTLLCRILLAFSSCFNSKSSTCAFLNAVLVVLVMFPSLIFWIRLTLTRVSTEMNCWIWPRQPAFSLKHFSFVLTLSEWYVASSFNHVTIKWPFSSIQWILHTILIELLALTSLYNCCLPIRNSTHSLSYIHESDCGHSARLRYPITVVPTSFAV